MTRNEEEVHDIREPGASQWKVECAGMPASLSKLGIHFRKMRGNTCSREVGTETQRHKHTRSASCLGQRIPGPTGKGKRGWGAPPRALP